jgi:hypothetical protein
VEESAESAESTVSVVSLRELRDWLAGKGIPLHRWGIGEAKRVEDLWSELRTGESVLTDPPPRRRASFVSLIVRRGDKYLIEVAQELVTGYTRERDWPPSEKLLPGEDVAVAAFRCAEEELGVPRAACRIVSGTHTEVVEKWESPSYPGLRTTYRKHRVEMEIPGLPEGAFSTPENAGSGDTAVQVHHWDWKRI